MKHTSTLRTKTLQRGAIATVVIAASALGISAWAQKDAEPASAVSASTPVTAAAPAASNIPATRGQVGPQDMVTVAPHLPEAKIDGATAKDPVIRGEYLARMGDCVACHTAPGGKPFAGGLPLGSPIGTMYSSNITPDKTAGIGSYSFEEFDQAVRHGKDKRKGSLYPAMPYPSYAQVSTQDMQDLYAYFMQKVEPVSAQVPDNDIPWPLSMRWPVSIWRGMFAPNADKIQAKAEAVAPTADAKLRGAYLVEGLGHCGACHTPRSFTMAEKGLDSSDSRFLSGGNAPMDGWVAKSLRGNDADGLGSWSEDDIVALLKTGRNNHTAVFGGMGDVIAHSTQYISDGDLKAIAVYLKSLPAQDKQKSRFTASSDTANALWKGDTKQYGSALYLDNCAACHRTDGKGYQQVFPALAGNAAVLSDDPNNLIRIVLQGGKLPATATRPSTFTMPAFAWRMSDQQVADLVTFVRSSWGNQAGAVSATQVKDIRKSLPAPATAQTAQASKP